MKLGAKKYYGKVLLFGEYTVIQGSNALAVPSSLFHGKWDFNKEEAKTQKILYDLYEYLKQLDLPKVKFAEKLFKNDLDQDLFFSANIPIGYGVGSSGAVCAAIFDTYYEKEKALEIDELKSILAAMENFFHGSSSGLDPLVSYLHKAILLKEGQLIETSIPQNSQDFHLFLVDTEVPRRTAPLVDIFLKKLQNDSDFLSLINNQLIPFNNRAIAFMQAGDLVNLFEVFAQISSFQYEHFEPMILDNWKAIWTDSLKSDYYKLKLCGAGGGGFILGMTNDWAHLENNMANLEKKIYRIY